jgi:hypothetical protein
LSAIASGTADAQAKATQYGDLATETDGVIRSIMNNRVVNDRAAANEVEAVGTLLESRNRQFNAEVDQNASAAA